MDVAGGTRTIAVGQVAPRCARAQHPEDAVQHTPVVDTRHASRLVGQQRLDHAPFEVGQIISAHVELESAPRPKWKRLPSAPRPCAASSFSVPPPSGHGVHHPGVDDPGEGDAHQRHRHPQTTRAFQRKAPAYDDGNGRRDNPRNCPGPHRPQALRNAAGLSCIRYQRAMIPAEHVACLPRRDAAGNADYGFTA